MTWGDGKESHRVRAGTGVSPRHGRELGTSLRGGALGQPWKAREVADFVHGHPGVCGVGPAQAERDALVLPGEEINPGAKTGGLVASDAQVLEA